MDQDTLAMDLISMQRANNKRWFIVTVILIIALILSNAFWVWYNMQWEYEVTDEYNVDTQHQGGNAIINTGNGEVDFNGESKLQENQKEAPKKD